MHARNTRGARTVVPSHPTIAPSRNTSRYRQPGSGRDAPARFGHLHPGRLRTTESQVVGSVSRRPGTSTGGRYRHRSCDLLGVNEVCRDNAVAESAWSLLKRELVHRYRFGTRAEPSRAKPRHLCVDQPLQPTPTPVASPTSSANERSPPLSSATTCRVEMPSPAPRISRAEDSTPIPMDPGSPLSSQNSTNQLIVGVGDVNVSGPINSYPDRVAEAG